MRNAILCRLALLVVCPGALAPLTGCNRDLNTHNQTAGGVASCGICEAMSKCEGRFSTSTGLSVSDFDMAASRLVQSMMTSGVFAKFSKQQAILGIDRVTNETMDQFDTDLLIKKIRVELLKTDRVRVNATPSMTDFRLTATIHQKIANTTEAKQSSFIFLMILVDTNPGNAVWGGEETITKQMQKNAVAF